MPISVPMLNGVAIFGRSVVMKTTDNPHAEQVNHFFGLSGVERLYGGLTGRVTLGTGVLAATTAPLLAAARESVRAYAATGQAYTLVDTLGVSWSHVVLRQFDPAERILRDARGFYLPYRVILNHLS